MAITSKAAIEAEISRLTKSETAIRNELHHHLDSIQQFFNPAHQLRKYFVKRKEKQPVLIDNLIDQSVSEVVYKVTDKVNLPFKDSMIVSKINSATQQAVSKFLFSKTLKIRAVVRAIVKNVFN